MAKTRSRKTTPPGALARRPRPIVVHVPSAARPDWRSRWEDLKASAVHRAWLYQMQNPGARCFLYYDAAQGDRWGAFYVVPENETAEQPPGILPVSPETVPAQDKTTIARWLERYAGQLPMIGGDPVSEITKRYNQ